MHDPRQAGVDGRRLMSILNEERLRRVLAKMLDENEFLSPYGLRSISRYHADHPYVISAGGQVNQVAYLPAESDSGLFGGNSNWRGPVWMPVNVLIIRALLRYHEYYGDDVHDRVPDRLGSADESAAGRRGARSPVDGHLPERRRGPATRLRRNTQVPGRSALA